jgi:hypothetical protein
MMTAPVLAKIPRSCPPLIENVLPVVPAHHANTETIQKKILWAWVQHGEGTQQDEPLPQDMAMGNLWGTTSPTKCVGLGYNVVPPTKLSWCMNN